MEDGPPSFPRDSSCPAVLWIQPVVFSFRLRDSHTLRLPFPWHLTRLPQYLYAVRTPHTLLHAVWPPPLSLATTRGISVDFFSSPYLDVSVQALPLVRLFYSPHDDRTCLRSDFSIRIPTAQRLLTANRGFSQFVASFFGSWCQGIHLAPFVA